MNLVTPPPDRMAFSGTTMDGTMGGMGDAMDAMGNNVDAMGNVSAGSGIF